MFLFGKRKFNMKEALLKNVEYLNSNTLSIDDINTQFIESDSIEVLKISNVNFPTGNVMISDAITNLPFNRFSPILDINISSGLYTIEVSMLKNKNIGMKVCAIKLKVNDDKILKYELSKFIEETSVRDGKKYGVPVREGLISICDARDALEYQNYISNWNVKNGNKNFYQDYLKRFFHKEFNGMNYIEWINPESKNKLLMFPCSFPNSFYQVFLGYNDKNQVSEVIIPMLNPKYFE